MKPCKGLGWGCALVLLFGTAACPARAEGDGVFQECCHCGGPAVACYPPAPCCPAPVYSCQVTTCYEAPRCGPIRRLLHRCCLLPVTSCRPCCAPPVPAPVACAPACAPPPCTANVLPGPPVPAPAPAVPNPPIFPAPTAVPNGVAPVPVAPAGDGEERHLSPVPATPAPVSGSTYRPQQPIAPVPPQTLTPPRPPTPVPLDHFVSVPGRQGRQEVQAVPATLLRADPSR
jgi:hypothetical protein